MPDFKNIQSQLLETKKGKTKTQRDVFLMKERLAKLERSKGNVLRSNSKDSPAFQQIARQERQLKAQLADIEGKLLGEKKSELDLLRAFEPFCDPRKNVEEFSDDFPMLLFPVRLETRFKKITSAAGGLQHQLWVRIFPDDCSIDTFEDVLSEAEVIKAKNYWMTTWAAGASVEEELKTVIRNKQIAAWKGLTGNLQPGRGFWITQNYTPVNPDDLPERKTEGDVILVIDTENLPTNDKQELLVAYWKKVWLANKDGAIITEAFTNLSQELGGEQQALALVTEYSPFNFKDEKLPNVNPPEVQVVFIQFPKNEDKDIQLSAWSQPVRVATLPEKFVLLGFKGQTRTGDPIQILNEIGKAIPNPLIVGPNPSLDTNEVLKEKLIEDYNKLNTEELKKEKLAELYDGSKDVIRIEISEAGFIANFLALPEDQKNGALEEIFVNLKEEIKAAHYIEFLCGKSETKWLFDFEEAVRMGMGFKVNLSEVDYRNGFDRLFVLGVKISADEEEGKATLENLIQHHQFGTTGFSILPQGTPTNNTEDDGSGFSESENAEETFERYVLQEDEDDPDDFTKKKDGKWFAELLGIDIENAALKLAANYYQTDQCEAKAMNTAMWNATIGHFMESMMTPVFSETDENKAYQFFTEFVSGRGNIPAIRIGNQPYGILATAPIKKLKWPEDAPAFDSVAIFNQKPGFKKMYDFFIRVCNDWQLFKNQVAQVGNQGDPHQVLLDVLGLHATSVEFHQRFARSLLYYWNAVTLNGSNTQFAAWINAGFYQLKSLDLLKELGYSHEGNKENIPLLEKFFLTEANLVHPDENRENEEDTTEPKDALIDDQPLSESRPIRPYTVAEEGAESKNYIHWLLENATTDQDNIKLQKGFADEAPTALLYLFLRHALTLEFSNTALQLHQQAEILTSTQLLQAKIDKDFIGVQVEATGFQSKYDYLDRKDVRITNDEELTISKYISTLLKDGDTLNQQSRLPKMMEALEHLKDVPTARLERAFVEHLDCCTYRLDAWLLGFVNMRLMEMRYPVREEPGDHRPGLYLGAYGWVENLQPDEETLTPAPLREPLKSVFDPENSGDIVLDDSNAGYIHAPSLNQAVTAAVLRNAYISNASPQDPEVYKVNLSSERVRMALSIIEGMQQGQSLGALLGYQLERGLHDRHNEAEVDFYIYELRIAFPLKANKNNETAEDDADVDSITQIEARNVIDGLALIEHIKETNLSSYPFGKPIKEDQITDAQRSVIDTEVQRLININDALADVAMAEGIHHAVQANYDRASGTLETYSKGSFPQQPEIIRTPRSGISLTNRVGIHFESELSFNPGDTPRTKAEPAMNQFLKEVLPDLSEIYCKVSYTVPTYGEEPVNSPVEEEISLDNFALSHLDLLYLLNVEGGKSLSALDEYILKWIHRDWQSQGGDQKPRPDIEIEIKYTENLGDKISVFEIMPMMESLRAMLLAARPLKGSDIALPNEANEAIDANCAVDVARINAAFGAFKTNFPSGDVNNDIDLSSHDIVALFDEEDFEKTMTEKSQIIDKIDDYIEKYKTRLYNLSRFGIQQAGFGFIYDRKAAIYSAIHKKVLAYYNRWLGKQAKYQGLIADYNNALANTATVAEKIEILQKAERVISTNYTIPLPTGGGGMDAAAEYKVILDAKEVEFEHKLLEIKQFLGGNFVKISDLLKQLHLLKTGENVIGNTVVVVGEKLSKFDLLTIDTEEEERQIVVFAEDLKIQAVQLNVALQKKATAIESLLGQHAVASNPQTKVRLLTEAAQLLFGEVFKLIPEFTLSATQAAELQNSLNDTFIDATDNNLEKPKLIQHQINDENVDFPVDDWLYGIARVREKMEHLENVIILSENFKTIEHELTPLQLPYQPDDIWLALSYPETHFIDNDKLLYTAHISNNDFTKPLCGLLIDEWTEIIPAKTETTGMSFQYDQPNAEPPQAMLLVTPAAFTKKWEWDDIVNSLHETLDTAALRAIEPRHYAATPYAQFLPATISAVTRYPFATIAMNIAINNGQALTSE